ncbi:MAG: hypothetical protein ACXVMS_14455 [Flavisolibacter sp.]
MTLFDYQLLTQNEQIELLYEHGVYIGKQKDGELTALLFGLESFYVEVYYKKYRCLITKLHCFSSTALIEPYLDQIDVEHLMYTP